jgi:nucleoside-diphosphate-sugar epimerase
MILITGASGFVGGALVGQLLNDPTVDSVVLALRRPIDVQHEKSRSVIIGDLGPNTNWSEALEGVRAIVHCAARVHVMHDKEIDPLKAYREVNVYATLNLARQAAQKGVRRFVFVSSIKVNGEASAPGQPISPDVIPSPIDPYGISKWEAESGLREIGARYGMEIVIVRPPLIYGPGVKANFLKMMQWVKFGIPLPLGNVKNLRSFVGIDNLVDFLMVCLRHPLAAGQTFMISDGEDVSTSELLKRTAKAMSKNIFLIPFPLSVLNLLAKVIRKEAVLQRLCGTLQVDIIKNRQLLGWTPVIGLDEGLLRAVRVVHC